MQFPKDVLLTFRYFSLKNVIYFGAGKKVIETFSFQYSHLKKKNNRVRFELVCAIDYLAISGL